MGDGAAPTVTIGGGRCRSCGCLFAPFQTHGCERCGASGEALEPCDLPAAGVVTAAASVHLNRAPASPAPFGVAEITLDAGPVIRALTDGAVAAGKRVTRGADGPDGLPRFTVATA